MPAKPIDISGRKFGRWTVIRLSDARLYNQYAFDCICECGTERLVAKAGLIKGYSLSCGCLGRDILGNNARRHGLSRHALSGTWRSMRLRCNNPNHHAWLRYGGRGITVCKRWNKLENFIADMGKDYSRGLTIERRDNNLGYSPENCYWATPKQQSLNRENSHFIEFEGERLHISEWARRLQMPVPTLQTRLRRWPVDKAMTEPHHKHNGTKSCSRR